ncbi:MAG TPA: SDR family NAD(P)-dependent oxidoreductase [Steroidobacteraceae bacterium]|jgi:2-hydroxycyclohexanecarboxyl-CoA dehydrogenase|nr:SDR family NAD(P)-dependent oxidoreductase [Steroidobacteraceae bacterium]
MSNAAKNAIVTGGASGIGEATCHRLARDGIGIAVWDVDQAGAERVAAKLVAEGKRAVACKVDVSSADAIKAALERVHGALGPVQILVNSAGVTFFKPFMESSEQDWNRVFSINVMGLVQVTKAVVPDMLAAKWGRVINISSSSAQSGSSRMTVYSASKGAVVVFTKSLALELAATGITVNNIPPGFIDTPMLRASDNKDGINVDAVAAASPMKRAGRPEDIAAACAFLASDEAGYITGLTLGVNGGRYIA